MRIGRMRYKATVFERVLSQSDTGTDITINTSRFIVRCAMNFLKVDDSKSEFNNKQLQRLKMECRYSDSIMKSMLYPEKYFVEYSDSSYAIDHFETSIDRKWIYIYLRIAV
jgi:hypothetical protein